MRSIRTWPARPNANENHSCLPVSDIKSSARPCLYSASGSRWPKWWPSLLQMRIIRIWAHSNENHSHSPTPHGGNRQTHRTYIPPHIFWVFLGYLNTPQESSRLLQM